MTKDVRLHLRALVNAVIGDREDRRVVAPVLMAMLTTDIADFEKYHDVRHARSRVWDHDFLMARNKAAKP
jgi:hypothetical protein